MIITPEHRQSAGWLLVKGYATQRCVELRARLEGELSHEETIKTRAALREMKLLLSIEKPEQEFEINE